jgi:hypothetical protein
MQEIGKLALTQKAMAQFEKMHGPVESPKDGDSENGPLIICAECQEDWPCERMGIMLISQALAMLQSMIPTGNMSSLLQRFSQPPR